MLAVYLGNVRSIQATNGHRQSARRKPKSVSGKGHIAYDSYAMTPREAEEIRIQIAEAVQRRDEFYGKLKLSIEDLE
jgi:hypothetical protein